jgi:hypothetical protein
MHSIIPLMMRVMGGANNDVWEINELLMMNNMGTYWREYRFIYGNAAYRSDNSTAILYSCFFHYTACRALP